MPTSITLSWPLIELVFPFSHPRTLIMAPKSYIKPQLPLPWLEFIHEAEDWPRRSRLLLMHVADMLIDNGKEGGKKEGRKILVLVNVAWGRVICNLWSRLYNRFNGGFTFQPQVPQQLCHTEIPLLLLSVLFLHSRNVKRGCQKPKKCFILSSFLQTRAHEQSHKLWEITLFQDSK